MSIDIAGLGSIADLLKTGINKIWPDKTEIEKAKLAADMAQVMGVVDLAKGQLAINEEEAKSTNWFVAGWRPFIGWVCGTGLLYDFVARPVINGLITAILTVLGHTTDIVFFVALDTNVLVSCLGGLLGLGGLRTVEKVTGSEAKR